MINKFWYFIWEACEFMEIDLGWAAPHVFGWMIGAKKRKMEDLDDK